MTAWWKSGPQMTAAFWQHSVAIQQKSVTWLSTTRTLSLLQQVVTKPSECGACGPVHPSVFCRPMLPPSHLFRWERTKCLSLKFSRRVSGFVRTNEMTFTIPHWSNGTFTVNTLYSCSFALLLKVQHGTLVPLVQMEWCVSGNSTQSAWNLSKCTTHPFSHLMHF